MTSSIQWPGLVPDGLEWEEMPGERSWGVIIEANAQLLPELTQARAALHGLPILIHPDHYLHVTLRQLTSPHPKDNQGLMSTIGAIISSTPSWTAQVKGLRAFPTAIWANPDHDGHFSDLSDRLLAATEADDPPVGPYRAKAIGHMTLGYSLGYTPAEEVRDVLGPFEDLEIGTIEVTEAILAELNFVSPYPRWKAVRRFPFKVA